MPVRKRFCEASAAELLAGAGVAEAPVDVEGLAESLLLKVVRIPGWKHHARALLEHGEIRVNASESPEAQRFSIGHELGHHSIHPDGFVFSAHEDPAARCRGAPQPPGRAARRAPPGSVRSCA